LWSSAFPFVEWRCGVQPDDVELQS